MEDLRIKYEDRIKTTSDSIITTIETYLQNGTFEYLSDGIKFTLWDADLTILNSFLGARVMAIVEQYFADDFGDYFSFHNPYGPVYYAYIKAEQDKK